MSVHTAGFDTPMIVGGSDVTAGADWIVVLDPATDRVVGRVPRGGSQQAVAAVEAAAAALPAWRSASAWQRHDVLLRWAGLVDANGERLAQLVTAEQGKPIRESRAEIATAAQYMRDAAEDGLRVEGRMLPRRTDGRRAWVLMEPVGVVAAITPWNFPAVIAARKVAPALAVGCTVVLKPASLTPMSAIALADLGRQAGLPDGVFNVVTGDSAAIGDALLGDARVRQLSFTGSTEVGRGLMATAARHVTRLTLELGGLAPFIEFDDADLDAAADGFLAAKFRNGGQTCICPNVLLVHEAVAKPFLERVVDRVGRLRVGPGASDDTDIGPLVDDRALAKVEAHVEDAVVRGALLKLGGRRCGPRPGLADRFFEPTVIADVPTDAAVFGEETFGPVVALHQFATEEEAVKLANATPYGLAAYFYSRSASRMLELPSKLEFGIIGVNDGQPSRPGVPLGGLKASGLGREGGRWGIEDYLETKYISIRDGA
jgi:succinate-semialdehyde dehydrogenase/glutarate-semialdehyde dehydrogenase